jgi:hypothetical protein
MTAPVEFRTSLNLIEKEWVTNGLRDEQHLDSNDLRFSQEQSRLDDALA